MKDPRFQTVRACRLGTQRHRTGTGDVCRSSKDDPAVSGFLLQAETAGLWRLDSMQADFEVYQVANRILDTMVERAVFNNEPATEVVESMLDDLENLGETSP